MLPCCGVKAADAPTPCRNRLHWVHHCIMFTQAWFVELYCPAAATCEAGTLQTHMGGSTQPQAFTEDPRMKSNSNSMCCQ